MRLCSPVILACLAVAAFCSPAAAISFDVDYATFADLGGDTAKSYVELYFRVDRWSLAVSSPDDARPVPGRPTPPQRLGFQIDAAVVRAPGDTVAIERHAVGQPRAEGESGTAFDDLYTTVGMFIPPGSYTLAVTIADQYGPDRESRAASITVRGYPPGRPAISDIEFALSAGADTAGSRFSKHGLSILPNARRIFGFGAPMLFFYAELYHLAPGDRYALDAAVLDSSGANVRGLGPFEVVASGGTSVQVKGLNVMGMPDGRYRMRLSLGDPAGAVVAMSDGHFAVSRVPFLTPAVSRQFVRDVTWIASRGELARFEDLTPQAKATFVAEFWRKRDVSPETEINETKIEHYRRLAWADNRFGEPGMPGRGSDPGRVYVQYGAPDDIERNPSSMEGRPYQIWFYNKVEGGVQFVFADYSGTGRMTLIHSTARDEIHNEQWRQLIEPFAGTFRVRDEQRERARGNYPE